MVTARAAVVVAQADLNWALFLTGILLGVVLLVGAAAIALTSRWRRRNRDDRLTASDQLAQYRRLYEEGAISREEYGRLRNLLAAQLREAFDVPAKPAAPPPATPASAMPPPDTPPTNGVSPG